jgi:hypothetical protein
MLPMHNVVREVVFTIIPKLEQGLLDTGRPVVHRRVHPEAMELIHDAYYSMTMTPKERPHEYETTAMEAALRLAGSSLKFVADLGDPRIQRRLADPDVLANAPEYDDDKPTPDEEEYLEWKPFEEMPPLGLLTPAERERSQQVREARVRAERARAKKPIAQPTDDDVTQVA